jgi:hypothetical protein
MRAITEGDPEGAAIYKGWACDNLACLKMDAGDRVLRSALDSRQWALLAFEVRPEIKSFEVTCTAEAGELYLSYLHPPSYKYNKYNASSGNRYRNAGHGQGSEAGLDFGRAGRQTGPEYVAKRVMKSCHFGRAVTERIFVSPYVMRHCSAGFGGNGDFGGEAGGRGYAGSGGEGAVWSGQWFVGMLGPSCGPFDLCVKYVKREVEFLTKELEVRDIDLNDYVSAAESQPTNYTNLYANSRSSTAQSATSGYT